MARLPKSYWRSLRGRTLRIPVNDDRIFLAFVVWAEDYGLVLYGFGPYTDSEINTLQGELPPISSALTYLMVGGFALELGDWYVDDAFGQISDIPDHPTEFADYFDSSVVKVDPNNFDREIGRKRGDFADLIRLPRHGTFNSLGFEYELARLSTNIGDVVRNPANEADRSDARPIRAPAVVLSDQLRGRVVELSLHSEQRLYSWIVNQAGNRVDCLFYLDDPVLLSAQIADAALAQAAIWRAFFSAEEWFHAAVMTSKVRELDCSHLGEFANPVFGRTIWDYPRGRHDYWITLEREHLQEVEFVRRVAEADMRGIHYHSLHPLFGVHEELTKRIDLIVAGRTPNWFMGRI